MRRVSPFVAALFFAACLPGAKVNLTLKLQDEHGHPIPGALVLAGAWLTVQPPLDAPYDRPLAAARGMTDAQGAFHVGEVRGFDVGMKPQDALYKTIESWQPKVKHRVTGIEGGSILVLAPGYGLAEQSFGVVDDPTFQKRRKGLKDEELPYILSWFGATGQGRVRPAVLVSRRDVIEGKTITVVMKKPATPEAAAADFNIHALTYTVPAASKKVGATPKDKDAVYDFFESQLRYAVSQSSDPYFAEQLAAIEQPSLRTWYGNQDNKIGEDTSLDSWLTEKSLELLPDVYSEPKRYVLAIQKGVADEGAATASTNHFYNPNDPQNAGAAGAQTVLAWGAIEGLDNQANAWDWQDALRYYRAGDKERAYEALGHVLHLLEDMAQPERTHVIDGAGFEERFASLLKEGNGSLPWNYYVDAKAPVPVGSLKDHFDALARMTFGPMKDGGRILDFDDYYRAERGGKGTVLRVPDAATYDEMGEYLLPRTIEYGTGLLERFEQEARPEARVDAAKGVVNAGGDEGNLQPSPGPAVQSQSIRAMALQAREAEQGRLQREVEDLQGYLRECHLGKRNDTDKYVILRRMLQDYAALRMAKTPEAQAALKEWRDLLVKHSNFKFNPPSFELSEQRAKQRQENGTATAPGRDRFSPEDSVALGFGGHERKAIAIYQYRVEFFSLPESLAIHGPEQIAGAREAVTSGSLKPIKEVTFQHPVDRNYFVKDRSTSSHDYPTWICTSFVNPYVAKTPRERAALPEGSIQWTNKRGQYGDFCGALSDDGRVVFQIPAVQHSPDNLLTTLYVGMDDKRERVVVARGREMRGVDGEKRVGQYSDIMIWEYPPSEIQTFAADDRRGLEAALQQHSLPRQLIFWIQGH